MVDKPPTKTTPTFLTQLILGRWFTVFASFLVMAMAGATYSFGIYSKDIKTSLNYNQHTLNTLGFFKDLGANVGLLAGLINEIAPPWVVLSIGATMNLFGYLMIYLAITSKIPHPSLWHMCLYICIGANSQSFSNTGALVTCVKNFPHSRGIVLGLLKGFTGLSSAIFTQLYKSIYGDDSKSLVLLIAWLPAAVSLAFVGTIRIFDDVKRGTVSNNSKPFFYFLYISVVFAVYLMAAIILEQKYTFSRAEYIVNALVICFLLFSPLAVVIREEARIRTSSSQETMETNPPVPVMSITIDKPIIKETPHPKRGRLRRAVKAPNKGEDYSILQALVSIEMIALLTATICGVGGVLTAIDNMGQIGESQGYSSRSISTFVSLISIWNYAGRVSAGFVSEFLISKYRFSRPLLLTIVMLLSCISHLLIAFAVPNSLYFSSVVTGYCFGAQQPLIFSIISEIFGLKYFSTLYNIGGMASPIGSYILNVKITGRMYDVEAAKQKNGVKELTCFGVQCFRKPFFIITGTTVVGAVVSLVLVYRTWEFYKGDIYAKFGDECRSDIVCGGDKTEDIDGKNVGDGEGEGNSLNN